VLPATRHRRWRPRLNPAYRRKIKSWVDLGVGYIPRWFICPRTVTYLDINHFIATRPDPTGSRPCNVLTIVMYTTEVINSLGNSQTTVSENASFIALQLVCLKRTRSPAKCSSCHVRRPSSIDSHETETTLRRIFPPRCGISTVFIRKDNSANKCVGHVKTFRSLSSVHYTVQSIEAVCQLNWRRPICCAVQFAF